ncbi:hypothetical protein U2I83_18420 [Bacillus amyloliquefaciens]|uniref:hypothetical protein n=1 Tax=Bacillus amyloliquefaciens TaxID=1390 RepID=UPI0032DF63B1
MNIFADDIEIAAVKEVGRTDVVLEIGEEEMIIDLSPEEYEELQLHLVNQENLLVPINVKSKQIFWNVDTDWLRENLDELISAAAEQDDK